MVDVEINLGGGGKPEWPEPWSPAIANSFAIFSTPSVDEGEGGTLGAC